MAIATTMLPLLRCSPWLGIVIGSWVYLTPINNSGDQVVNCLGGTAPRLALLLKLSTARDDLVQRPVNLRKLLIRRITDCKLVLDLANEPVELSQILIVSELLLVTSEHSEHGVMMPNDPPGIQPVFRTDGRAQTPSGKPSKKESRFGP